jgi:hypothetical protein
LGSAGQVWIGQISTGQVIPAPLREQTRIKFPENREINREVFENLAPGFGRPFVEFKITPGYWFISRQFIVS